MEKILKWTLKKQGGKVWTGLTWFGSEAYPDSYAVGIWGCFPEKGSVRETGQLPPSSVEVENMWSYTSPLTSPTFIQ
jgi:hypothetical protein